MRILYFRGGLVDFVFESRQGQQTPAQYVQLLE